MIAAGEPPECFPEPLLGRQADGRIEAHLGHDSCGAGHNTPVDLARIAWLAAVMICLITVLILVLEGYLGYAGVTFAVAVAAAINLF